MSFLRRYFGSHRQALVLNCPQSGGSLSDQGDGVMEKRMLQKFDSIGRIQKGFEGTGYICSQQIATTLYLAFHLDKPILVEGAAGARENNTPPGRAALFAFPRT